MNTVGVAYQWSPRARMERSPPAGRKLIERSIAATEAEILSLRRAIEDDLPFTKRHEADLYDAMRRLIAIRSLLR